MTTNDPFLSATLVRPPGVTYTSSFDSKAKGLKSTCLGTRPDLVKIGHVDKDKVGCAIYFLGLARIFYLKELISSEVAKGPISIP